MLNQVVHTGLIGIYHNYDLNNYWIYGYKHILNIQSMSRTSEDKVSLLKCIIQIHLIASTQN